MSRKVGSVVNYVVPHLTRCWQKFTGNNHGDQEVNFGPQNSLNLSYAHLQSKKFSGGYTPGPPLKGEGKGGGEGGARREGQGNREERVGKEGYGQDGGKGGEGKACIGPPPLFQILDTPLDRRTCTCKHRRAYEAEIMVESWYLNYL
jgi:hypothetical protein